MEMISVFPPGSRKTRPSSRGRWSGREGYAILQAIDFEAALDFEERCAKIWLPGGGVGNLGNQGRPAPVRADRPVRRSGTDEATQDSHAGPGGSLVASNARMPASIS